MSETLLSDSQIGLLKAARRRFGGTARRTEWVVIAGGPGSGKTTLIELLRGRGQRVVHDAARVILDRRIRAGLSSKNARSDYPLLQTEVLARMRADTQKLHPFQRAFFDYGFADILAFLAASGHPWSEDFLAGAFEFQFARVFVLETIPSGVNADEDPLRIETAAQRALLQRFIVETYNAMGDAPVMVPVLPPEERLMVVLHHLEVTNATRSRGHL